MGMTTSQMSEVLHAIIKRPLGKRATLSELIGRLLGRVADREDKRAAEVASWRRFGTSLPVENVGAHDAGPYP